ncbi:MAG: type II toxin-antitoxin system HicA family toxin [Bacteroidales bacterium]
MDLLKVNGWTEKEGQGKGSHRLFIKPGKRPIIVPGKLSDDLAIGTERSIFKSAGLL